MCSCEFQLEIPKWQGGGGRVLAEGRNAETSKHSPVHTLSSTKPLPPHKTGCKPSPQNSFWPHYTAYLALATVSTPLHEHAQVSKMHEPKSMLYECCAFCLSFLVRKLRCLWCIHLLCLMCTYLFLAGGGYYWARASRWHQRWQAASDTWWPCTVENALSRNTAQSQNFGNG